MTIEEQAEKLVRELLADKSQESDLEMIKSYYRYRGGAFYYRGPCEWLIEECCLKGSRYTECDVSTSDKVSDEDYWIDFNLDSAQDRAHLGGILEDTFHIDLWTGEDAELGICLFEELVCQRVITLNEDEENKFRDQLMTQQKDYNCAVDI